ncbi:hypothetical protein EON64_12725, partial [archaeon]
EGGSLGMSDVVARAEMEEDERGRGEVQTVGPGTSSLDIQRYAPPLCTSMSSGTRSTNWYSGARYRERVLRCLLDMRQLLVEAAGVLGWEEDIGLSKDYVSNPKASGYQSYHLSLWQPHSGLRLEVQLRSLRMHEIAEYGSASHAKYKALLLSSSKTL